MSGECLQCGEHTLECICKGKTMKRWISIGDNIINTEFFNAFYFEEIDCDEPHEWHLFGEDQNQVCWRLMKFQTYGAARNVFDDLKEKVLMFS